MPLDLIITAIIGAVAKLSEPVVKDAYEGLKNLLVRKFGQEGLISVAITEME